VVWVNRRHVFSCIYTYKSLIKGAAEDVLIKGAAEDVLKFILELLVWTPLSNQAFVVI